MAGGSFGEMRPQESLLGGSGREHQALARGLSLAVSDLENRQRIEAKEGQACLGRRTNSRTAESLPSQQVAVRVGGCHPTIGIWGRSFFVAGTVLAV